MRGTGGVANPALLDPGISDPGISDPGISDPGISDPGISDPGITDLDFPGCYARPMTLAEFEAFEGKVEYFDGGDEVAWIAKLQNDPVKQAILARFGELMEGVAAAAERPLVIADGLEIRRRRVRKAVEPDPQKRAQRAEFVHASIAQWLLGERGVAVPDAFPTDLTRPDRERLREASEAEVVAAADAATSVADFLAHLEGCDD